MASSYQSTNIKSKVINEAMADDGTFLLPYFGNGAKGTLIIGSDSEDVDFSIANDGTVSILHSSTSVVANADTDTKFCIGTSVANPLTIKNRLGAAKIVTGSVWYG